jgi:hypothetical protein
MRDFVFLFFFDLVFFRIGEVRNKTRQVRPKNKTNQEGTKGKESKNKRKEARELCIYQ